MQEEIIVSMTTWKPRMHNIPIVLDTIYAQTIQPNKVVINLAYDEVIPKDILSYISEHQIEINYVPNTKVYKKFLPTLLKYPEACVINIDDDCIFPPNMIEDFMVIHKKYPQFPISGNKVVLFGLQCHCGNASLTKYEHFGDNLKAIDEDLMQNCTSSDIVYTYLAAKNNHPYICSEGTYFDNVMQDFLEHSPYTRQVIEVDNGIIKSFQYLVKRFGELPIQLHNYVPDEYLATLITRQIEITLQSVVEEQRVLSEEKVRSSSAYRLGKFFLKPLSWGRNLLKRNK